MTFEIRTRSIRYGDKRTFIEYKILMFDGAKLVGIEDGPRRSFEDRPAALRAARRRIKVLRSHRLFAVRVTRKNISDGEARNCNTCAIAQALWHNQERMGLPRSTYSFEVSPYGAFSSPRGIVLRRYDDSEKRIPPVDLPELVLGQSAKHIFQEGLSEWAMRWDDWAEFRYMSAKEWRELYDEDLPYRPGPCSFVLDLDAMQEVK